MAFKIGKIQKVKRTCKVNQPGDGNEMIEHKIKVGYNIFSISENNRLREALVAEKVSDIDGEMLKRHVVTEIEDGPAFEEADGGKALTVDECLDVPWIRAGIEQDYNLVCAGIKRKN